MQLSKLSVVAISAVLLSQGGGAAEPAGGPCDGGMPAGIALPAGNELAFALSADGVQVYQCAASGASFAWAFQAPEASLSEAAGGTAAGTHGAGPTWRASDGSTVVGAKVGAATPDPGSIPWLLLRAASHEGSGRMEEVTFVTRIHTRGGNAPRLTCDAEHAGVVARVPYRAVYCFYKQGGAVARSPERP